MKNQNLATKIFQNYINNRDIRFFKRSIFYYLFYRALRKFFNKPLIVKIYDFYLFSDNKKTKASYSILQKCDFFDKAEINFIKEVSKKSSIFLIDCGSNFGFYSLFVCSLSNKNNVISIEASPDTFKEFKNNIDLNKFNNIKYFNKAVSYVDNAIVELKESEKDWESSIISSDYKVINSIKIDTITLDTVLREEILNEETLIIKIDVEGGDLDVLAGAKKIIQQYKPIIIIEFSRYITQNQRFNYDYLKAFLVQNEYEIYNNNGKILSVDDILSEINKLDKIHNTIGNYFLFKKENKSYKDYLR